MIITRKVAAQPGTSTPWGTSASPICPDRKAQETGARAFDAIISVGSGSIGSITTGYPVSRCTELYNEKPRYQTLWNEGRA